MAKSLTLAIFTMIIAQGTDRSQDVLAPLNTPPSIPQIQLFTTLNILSSSTPASGLCSTCTTVPGSLQQRIPTIGDIKLVPYNGDSNLQGYYEVQVFFSNGVDQPGYGGICADNSYSQEAEVICRQLGYTYEKFKRGNTSTSVWLKGVLCKQSDLHILRCRYKVIYGSERTNQNICGPQPNKFLIKCGKPLPPYNGQLALCPADSATDDPDVKLSVSSGMVSLYLKLDGTWRGLNTKTLLGTTEANTICRQMGFTGAVPGSAVQRSASASTFKKCFDDSEDTDTSELPFTVHHGAWMKTDSITCPGPQKCLGCCYTYPHEGACNDVCDPNHTLIINCTFDRTPVGLSTGSSGSDKECQLNSANKITHCEPGCSKTIHDLRVGLGIITSLLIILGPFGIICLCYLYKKYLHEKCRGICGAMFRVCPRCGYRRMDDDDGN